MASQAQVGPGRIDDRKKKSQTALLSSRWTFCTPRGTLMLPAVVITTRAPAEASALRATGTPNAKLAYDRLQRYEVQHIQDYSHDTAGRFKVFMTQQNPHEERRGS